MKEIWRDIEGYECLYQVSNLGRIKSLKFWSNVHKKYYEKETILKNKINKHGYEFVGLHKHNKTKNFSVHRLVAEAFIDNPKMYKEVNHIDGNKLNNNVENLEFTTRSENMLHAYKLTFIPRLASCKAASLPASPAPITFTSIKTSLSVQEP